MKIRTGFVSNSSSSSFLVMLDERPKTIDHLRKLIFSHIVFSSKGDFKKVYEKLYNPYNNYDHEPVEGKDFFTTKAAAEYLGVPKKKNICLVSKDNKEKMIEFIADSLLSGTPEHIILTIGKPSYPKDLYFADDTPEKKEETYKKLDKYNKERDKWACTYAKFIAEMLIREDSGKYLCKFRASDNDSALGATVEHGETFKDCPFYLRFSQH